MNSKTKKIVNMISIDRDAIKRALIITWVIFMIGLIFKIVDKSMATNNYFNILDTRDSYNEAKNFSPEALRAWHAWDNGGKDQLVGVTIGWPLIVLKIFEYGTTIYTLNKALKQNEIKENKYFVLAAKFAFLAFGLIVGEAITIWLTERNHADHTPRVIYSFVSPCLSIVFALFMMTYFIKMKQKYNPK